MGLQTLMVGLSVSLTLIGTVAYMIYQRTRYVTNNRNATADEFQVFGSAQCPVCLESMEDPGYVIINCGHGIHLSCLLDLQRHGRMLFPIIRCPVCRTPIRLE